MRAPDPIVITPPLRLLVAQMMQRLGLGAASENVAVAPGWLPVAQACLREVPGVESSGPTPREPESAVAIGPAPFVVESISSTTANEFGFVMPVAQQASRWQRADSWTNDATLDLWHAGWSPVDLDRLVVATHEAVIEFVIGNARPLSADLGDVSPLRSESS